MFHAQKHFLVKGYKDHEESQRDNYNSTSIFRLISKQHWLLKNHEDFLTSITIDKDLFVTNKFDSYQKYLFNYEN